MRLHDLKPDSGSRRRRRRLGRGISAGGGKTAGRGQKGQGSRSSWSLPRAFEGGQMPLTQRVPKLRGFHNRFRVEYQVVNCGKLGRIEGEEVVDAEVLRRAGLVRDPRRPVKLLAGGGDPPALTVRVHKASRAAAEALRRAGGTLELLELESEPGVPDAAAASATAPQAVEEPVATAEAETPAAEAAEPKAQARPRRRRAKAEVAEAEPAPDGGQGPEA